MGWFGDAMDNYFGVDPSPQAATLTTAQKAWLLQQQAEAGGSSTATDTTPAATDTTTAAATTTPTTTTSTFDATPYKSTVDSSFSQFTPEWYANKYASYYDPYKSSVADQYTLAKDALTAGLAKKGLGSSSQSKNLFQQLDSLRDQTYNQGQSTAQNFQTSLSDAVSSAKNTLYGSIAEGADNASIGTRASSEASKIAGTATPSSTLGDVFGSLVSPYADAASPGGPVNPETTAFATGSNLNLANTGGGGAGASTKVVGNRKKF